MNVNVSLHSIGIFLFWKIVLCSFTERVTMAGWGKEPREAFILKLLQDSERPSGCSRQTLHALSTLPFLQMGDEGAPTTLYPLLTLGERRAYVP